MSFQYVNLILCIVAGIVSVHISGDHAFGSLKSFICWALCTIVAMCLAVLICYDEVFNT